MIFSKLLAHPRMAPFLAKLKGIAPHCPWQSILAPMDPRTRNIYPPKFRIDMIRQDDGLALLEFDGTKRFWFPLATPLDEPLWSEYLVCFWSSPVNYHHYFNDTVKISPGDTVVDCGACEGFFTRAALDAGAGKVICIEPAPNMVRCLNLTFADEISSGRVVIEEVALGSHHGKANFESSADNAFAGRMDGNSDVMVELTTLATIAKRHGNPRFIKMDLEGAEYEALLGGIELITRTKPTLSVTTYHYPWDYPAIHALLKEAGYASPAPRGVTLREGTIPRPVLIQAH